MEGLEVELLAFLTSVLEVSDQLHVPPALLPGKKIPVGIELEAGLAPEPV